MCQLEQGKFEAARHSFLKAMAHQERLLAEYPGRQDLQKNYGSLCGSLAVVSVRLNRPEDAFKTISKSFEINSDLAQKHPGNLEYVGEKSKSLTNLVAILANANRLDEAATYGHELIELQSRLNEENPNRSEFAYGFAASLNIVASVLGRRGQDEQATTYYDRSRKAYADLIQHNPQVHAYRMGLTNACLSKADFARARQNWQQAIEAYSQAIETIHNFKANSMAAESNLLARAYLGQAVAFKSLGQGAESQACAQLGAHSIMPWKDSPQGQEILLRCLELTKPAALDSSHNR
jgi:tetratricopeptide (TPR) repeat protein